MCRSFALVFCSSITPVIYARWRDHLVATVESYAPLMARAPKTFNFFINQPLVRKLSEKHIGMVDLPLLSVPSLQQQMVGHRSANMTLEQLESLNAEQKARTVLVVQDPFTSYYDAQVVADFVRLVEKLGFQPVLLPFSPNGKAQHIKGFLNRFAKTAKRRGFPQPYGEAGYANGGRRSGAGTLLSR
ncbi:putative FAD-binding oxidase [Escherichia coli]|nr:putative FAD-binding oxidase [Escherichia coli]